MLKFGAALAGLATIVGWAGSAAASTITWGAVTAITTADAALTAPANTTLVGAVGIGGGAGGAAIDVTVASQSVNFLSDGSAGSILTITQMGGEGIDAGGNVFTPTSGNANFDQVMSSFAYDGNPVIGELTGLTPGATYTVEAFASDDRGCCGGRTVFFSDGAGGNSGTFALNSNSYAYGTFTASGTTQFVQSVGAAQGNSNFNAVVLYQSVPEPASCVLLGLGVAGLLVAIRRRRRI